MELKAELPAPAVDLACVYAHVHTPAVYLGKAVKYLPRVTPRRPPLGLAAPTLWCELGPQLRHLGLQIVDALHQRHRMGATRLQQRCERAHLPHMRFMFKAYTLHVHVHACCMHVHVHVHVPARLPQWCSAYGPCA
jgi:hypothetical protein